MQTNMISQCGIVETPLIVGGVAAKPREFPHMVSDFLMGFRQTCRGELRTHGDRPNVGYAFGCINMKKVALLDPNARKNSSYYTFLALFEKKSSKIKRVKLHSETFSHFISFTGYNTLNRKKTLLVAFYLKIKHSIIEKM